MIMILVEKSDATKFPIVKLLQLYLGQWLHKTCHLVNKAMFYSENLHDVIRCVRANQIYHTYIYDKRRCMKTVANIYCKEGEPQIILPLYMNSKTARKFPGV